MKLYLKSFKTNLEFKSVSLNLKGRRVEKPFRHQNQIKTKYENT